MRSEQTDAERKLWRRLRAHRLNDHSFRRQTPIGPYIVDFVCHDSWLIIELDGGQHADPSASANDNKRTQWLESKGYRVIRFWNSEVLQNIDGIQQLILDAIATPLPNPPPQGGRGSAAPAGKLQP